MDGVRALTPLPRALSRKGWFEPALTGEGFVERLLRNSQLTEKRVDGFPLASTNEGIKSRE